ncbi:YdaS family helix-turn-helix protein [Novosphingobium sp. ST904]|uniref:YdaS family helix-turn-helix protein n=1 Tax=Novosphingobium sp. ST904 TaxID=1684385 RepID=UPI0006C884A2|nr:YdaS family helix-turn-helix protein [Novosphingobium sp. ST904]TCM43346.1 YdaS antitoxin of YdaST toxin-antitoxin system [Novosphingobium sp. ST904]
MGIYPLMDMTLTRYQALLACRDQAGSISQLGRDLRIPQSTMSRIINQSKQLPAEYVLEAERLYDVSRHLLRPDIYPIQATERCSRWTGTDECISNRSSGVDRRAQRVSFDLGDGSQGVVA